MPEGKSPFAPHLTVVRPATPSRSGTSSDWSRKMALAQAGNRQDYRELLLEIEPYIRSIARRCCRHPADVEDAVQDVLLTIHAIRHTYDPQRPFAPWLVAIANRRIIDRLRREARKAAREIGLTAEHETFSQAPTNRDEMAERALLEAIERLPPDQRDAVRMLKLNEMSLKEASMSSGRSVSALKVATHRAVANLRRLLKGGHAP